MQKIEFIGNLGNDVKVVNFDNGGKVANFSVAVTDRAYTTKSGIQVESRTEWFDCVAHNRLADVFANFTKKGHKVWISAVKRTRYYTGQDGKENKVVEFHVRDMELLTPKQSRQEPQPAAVQAPAEQYKQDSEEDLPF